MVKQFLLASDFDQTLSFNDSGVVLSELIGFHGFHDKVAGLSGMNLVQQGAELSYLILHDPEFRRVRREHLVETGKRIRLKHDVALFARALESLADGYKFSFYVISAAPQEIIQSALEGIVPRDHIFGLRRLGQNHRPRRTPRATRHQPRPDHLYGRWQFRSPGDDARQSI
jgi:2-hydroxy-3-keto-5-methylthiopentenyl-1-phosphate phosphatase